MALHGLARPRNRGSGLATGFTPDSPQIDCNPRGEGDDRDGRFGGNACESGVSSAAKGGAVVR